MLSEYFLMLMGTGGPPSRKATRMVSHGVYTLNVICFNSKVLSGLLR